jgi:hypothetical protein
MRGRAMAIASSQVSRNPWDPAPSRAIGLRIRQRRCGRQARFTARVVSGSPGAIATKERGRLTRHQANYDGWLAGVDA